MKSIYVEDQVHKSLKILASFEKRPLTDVVEECLELSLRKKLSDLPSELLERLAEAGGSFDFLLDAREDVYSLADGEPIE